MGSMYRDSPTSKPQQGWRTKRGPGNQDPPAGVRSPDSHLQPSVFLTSLVREEVALSWGGGGLHIKGYFDILSGKGVRKEGGWVFLDAA